MTEYMVVPEGSTSFFAIVRCRTAVEAIMFAEGEKIRTGNHYDVLEVRTIERTRKITPREAAKLAAQRNRENACA